MAVRAFCASCAAAACASVSVASSAPDRGCQYTSAQYRDELARLKITVSMSRKGNCWDNAVAESFFATLKNELVYRKTWNTRIELRTAVFEYIEVFYNRRRLHPALGYKAPAAIEEEYAQAA